MDCLSDAAASAPACRVYTRKNIVNPRYACVYDRQAYQQMEQCRHERHGYRTCKCRFIADGMIIMCLRRRPNGLDRLILSLSRRCFRRDGRGKPSASSQMQRQATAVADACLAARRRDVPRAECSLEGLQGCHRFRYPRQTESQSLLFSLVSEFGL
jgi:hypothetical protein